MKSFKLILNQLALFSNKSKANIDVNNNSPCCKAAYFDSRSSSGFKSIIDQYKRYLQYPLDDERRPTPGEFKIMFASRMLYNFKDFIANYCACQSLDTPFSNSEYAPLEEGIIFLGENDIESIDSTQYNNNITEDCKSKLNQDLSNVEFLLDIPRSGHGQPGRFDDLIFDTYIKYLSRLMTLFRNSIFELDYNQTFVYPRTDNLKNFLDDTCRMSPEQMSGLLARVREMLLSDPSIEKILDKLLKEPNYSTTEETVYIGCPPSPNDNSIVALATALGVSTVVAAIAYNAITRGKAKKCSDLATSSSRLTPLIIAAVGGSFATTQTSEATVQEKLQAVMQKECEGRLPYSCGDGGFEGPDEGDGSGEVDAPGGEGGIG